MVIVACSWVRARPASAGSCAIVFSQLAIVAGLVLSALFVRSGFWILTVLDALVAAGWTAIYTPIYDGASAACPQNHSGRSVGICDLVINGRQPLASLSTAR